MSKTTLCLCLFDEDIQVYKSTDQHTWTVMPLKGEESLKHDHDEGSIEEALKECNQRLNVEGKLKEVMVHIIYSQKNYLWLDKVLLQLKKLENQQLQILSWNTLLAYAQKSFAEKIDFPLQHETIAQYILPLTCLENSWHERQKIIDALNLQQQMQQQQFDAQKQENQLDLATELAQLQQEKQKLFAEIKAKEQQLANIVKPSLENLLSFLPSIFKNFWNVVRPDELANIAGLLSVPHIPSPYHNPTVSAVQAKKRQFLALGIAEQQQIIGFCQQLKHNYDLVFHLEFQSVIVDLD